MIIRLAMFLVMALGLAGFGTVTWISVHPSSQPGNAAVAAAADVRVYAAAHMLRPGALLKSDDVTLIKLPATDVADGALREGSVQPGDITGSMLRRTLRQGEPMLGSDLLHPADRGFLAAVLAPGMRAISVGVDVITGAAGLIWPGDHVDVLLTQSLDDATRPAGQRVAAHTVLSDIRVIAIDQKLAEGASPDGTGIKPAATVTLEVSSLQSERVAVAARIGRLSLVVRSTEPGQPETTEDHVTWGGDVSPALTVGAAQPSVETIRVYRGSADAKEFHF